MPNLLTDKIAAIHIINRSISIIATKWTNKGFRVRQDDGTHNVCLFGAINQATEELYFTTSHDQYLAPTVVNEKAIKVFGISGVSVNDELGLPYVIKLLSLSLEDILQDALGTNPNSRKLKLVRG